MSLEGDFIMTSRTKFLGSCLNNDADLIIKYSHKISELTRLAEKNNNIESEMYEKYDVKRGLRDKHGVGVLCGLTLL